MGNSGVQGTAKEDSDRVDLKVDGDLAILRLGTDPTKIVTLTPARMASLRETIGLIARDASIKGLVIAGAGTRGFCAGADINAIKSVTDPAIGRDLAKQGQDTFQAIADLSCTTVAAIGGGCVGGGCELSLACDYRVVADLPDTKVGLPEIKLGILPGFGGTQRLPRLIGLPQALSIILAGKVVPAGRAKKLGLADLIVAPEGGESVEVIYERLLTVASELALGRKESRRRALSFRDKLLTFTGMGRQIVASKARKGVLKETKGKYPAPLKALDSCLYGLSKGLEKGYAYEAEALGDLIITSESKSLVHIYFLTQGAAKLGAAAKSEIDDFQVGVIGGGTMGAGIAASFISKKVPVVIVDPMEQARERAEAHVSGVIEKKRSIPADKKKEYLSRLSITEDIAGLKGSSVIVEAALEDMSLKKEILSRAAELLSSDAIIASNTSSLSISDIAEAIPGSERVIGMHFFNPAEKMPLVEIVRGEKTSAKTIAVIAALTSKLGKYPVVVEDGAGFLVNRVLTPYLIEAAHLLADGFSISDIDKAAIEFGMPMGPIRLLDEVGLDVAAKVSIIVQDAYGERMRGPGYAGLLAEQKRFGRKSGAGFYRYEGEDAELDPEVRRILELPEPRSDVDMDEITDRLILPMVNEAVRCLDEGVAGMPGEEAAKQIDLGTVMGTGFAPFRGGVIRYADTRGAKDTYQRLARFQEQFGLRFAPCNGISKRAELSASFYEAV